MSDTQGGFSQQQVVTIKLQAQQWNIVILGLNEVPFRLADPVIKEIHAQAQAQLPTPAQPPAQPPRRALSVVEEDEPQPQQQPGSRPKKPA